VADGFKTVLLVDDEQQVLKLMLRLLRKENNKYEVLTASASEEALAVSRQAKYDIDMLITEINVGKMNGVELYRGLKQEHPTMVVMFVSGEAVDFANVHPDPPLLKKPFSPAEFLTKVRDTLSTQVAGAEPC
jgi:DNA-binding response OmpR family regulator